MSHNPVYSLDCLDELLQSQALIERARQAEVLYVPLQADAQISITLQDCPGSISGTVINDDKLKIGNSLPEYAIHSLA